MTTHGAEPVGVELLARQLSPPFSPPTAVFRAAMEEGMLAIVDEHVLGVSWRRPSGSWRRAGAT
ncbi:MAG: hypothetical protein R2755_03375 [Acidimicrobiales bacterium]